MIITPRVALFKSDEIDFQHIASLFAGHKYDLQVVTYTSELQDLIELTGCEFDAVVLSLRLACGDSGPDTCVRLRTIPELALTPIFALLLNHDPGGLRSFFVCGASNVLQPPLDADALNLHLCATAAYKRLMEEKVSRKQDALGLHSSTIAALNSVREGIVIFDAACKPVFLNRSARILLGLSSTPERQEKAQVKTILLELIKTLIKNGQNPEDEPLLASAKLRIQRIDGRGFDAVVRTSRIFGQGSSLAGYTVAISDSAEIDHLSCLLLQSHYVRTLCLFLGAAAVDQLRGENSGSQVVPVSAFESILEKRSPECSMAEVLFSLINTLDLAIGSEIKLRVDTSSDYRVALRFSDAFQILGQMILFAVEQAGRAGEISISFEMAEDGGHVIALMHCVWPSVTPLLDNDYLSSLRSGSFHWDADDGSAETQPSFAIQSAQKIADRYQTNIEFKKIPSGLKLRIALPLIQK